VWLIPKLAAARDRRALGVGAHDAHRCHQETELAGPIVRVQRGQVEIGAVLGAVDPVEHHRFGQPHGDERFAAAAQRSGCLIDRAAFPGERVEQIAGCFVLHRLVLVADHAEHVEVPVDGIGAHRGPLVGHWQRGGCGDTGLADHGLLGDHQRHFAHVPVGQVGGVQRLAGGHGVADLLAELVPGVGARVGEADFACGLIEFVGHGGFLSGGEWAVAARSFAFWRWRFGPV